MSIEVIFFLHLYIFFTFMATVQACDVSGGFHAAVPRERGTNLAVRETEQNENAGRDRGESHG